MKKSVLITIDDGALGTGIQNGNKLIPILEEYKMHATLFLITKQKLVLKAWQLAVTDIKFPALPLSPN